MGAPFIDYLTAGKIVVLQEREPFLTEKIVRLPDCYQVSDRPASDWRARPNAIGGRAVPAVRYRSVSPASRIGIFPDATVSASNRCGGEAFVPFVGTHLCSERATSFHGDRSKRPNGAHTFAPM